MADEERQEPQISELRRHLFDTLRELRDSEREVDRERVELTVLVSEQIIATGKLEVAAQRVAGGAAQGSGFLPAAPASGDGKKALPPAVGASGLRPDEKRRLDDAKPFDADDVDGRTHARAEAARKRGGR